MISVHQKTSGDHMKRNEMHTAACGTYGGGEKCIDRLTFGGENRRMVATLKTQAWTAR